jgi:hypothetical protein
MIIHPTRFLFGLVLFLSFSLRNNAFTSKAPFLSLARELRKSNIFLPNSGRFVEWRRKNSEASVEVVMVRSHGSIDEFQCGDDVDTEKETNGYLLVGLIGLLVASMARTSFAGAKTTSPIMHSAVSATMLRNSSSRGGLSWQQLLFGAYVLWQVQGNLLHVLTTSFSKVSTFYTLQLFAFPLITKAVTAAIVASIGDFGAQWFGERIRAREQGETITSTSFNSLIQKYDVRRGLSVFTDGLLVSGPILHFAYNWLERMIPVHGSSAAASLAALSHVVFDEIIMNSLFVAVAFVTTGIGEGRVRDIRSQFKEDYIPTVKASWTCSIVLIPIEFVCFRFLPLSFRVLGMNVVDIYWGAMISFMAHRNRKIRHNDGMKLAMVSSS